MTFRIKFLADGMFGSLARRLRMYGFDVLYDSRAGDFELIQRSLRDERTLLTADRELFKAAIRNRVSSILVTGVGDKDRVVEIFRKFGINDHRLDPNNSRCPSCNGVLESRQRKTLGKSIPKEILQRHKDFYACSSCQKIYWKGSHWRKIKGFSESVQRSLHRDRKPPSETSS